MEPGKGERRVRICNGFLYLLIFLQVSTGVLCARSPLVLQSDFGTKDGAVAAMKGVAVGVEPELKIYDLTHEIPAFNVWESAYRLWQTAPYWPAGTVFVSVVDPGVGTARKSVVARAKNGQYFVTPDNGTLTLIAEHLGLDAVRKIDEQTNRRPGAQEGDAFPGPDVCAYTGARLAAGTMRFEEVGPALDPAKLVAIPYQHATVSADGRTLTGGIPALKAPHGDVWTNIDRATFERMRPTPKPGDEFEATFSRDVNTVVSDYVGGVYTPLVNRPDDVLEGRPAMYLNRQGNVSFALNDRNFAGKFGIDSAGPEWRVVIKRKAKP